MEKIKQGYQRTDIGLIPTDWEVVELGDVSKYEGGSQPYLSYFSNRFLDGYIRLIQIRDYKTDKYAVYIPSNLARKTCNEKDIMIGRYGPPIFQILRGLNGAYNVALIKAIPNGKIDHSYFYFSLKREDLFQLIELLSRRSSGQTGVDLVGLKAFKIGLPMLSEQINIATALSNIDALIAALNKKITKKQQIKQGAMQQLLTGKKRLPGFSGDWVEKTIGQSLTIKHGKSQKDIEDFSGRYPILGTGGIISFTNIPLYSKQSVLIGRKGTIDKPQFFDTPFWTVDTLFYSEIKDGYSAKFIFYKFNQIDWYAYNEASGVPSLNAKVIESIIIAFPPTLIEQIAIAQVFTDMDNEISQLEADRNKYNQIKAGMMQQLLTGKIRLTGSVQTTVATEQTKIVELNSKKQTHTDQINEAVVISFLVNKFSSVQYPLSRFRYTKYTYLLHRQYEHVACGFKKHAAGPYKPENRYKGPENIAIKNKYISKVPNPKSKKDAFLVNRDIDKALVYFNEWYGAEIQQWIEQFRYFRNDDLEALTTVDESICNLENEGKVITVNSVKQYIDSIPQWKEKLRKDCFSDINIQKMINKSRELFSL
jgi:type I restriction enzyme S subunit